MCDSVSSVRTRRSEAAAGIFVRRFLAYALVVCGLTCAASDAWAQTAQRRRPSRRVTNPVTGQRPPLEGDEGSGVRVISTAEDAGTEAPPVTTEPSRTPRRRNTRQGAEAADASNPALRRTVEQLNAQVSQLTTQLAQMREQQAALVNFERLSRAEQRAENYRAQLRDVTQREAALQARLDQIEIDILPENIQMRAAGVGSLRAEQVREQMQTVLDKERTRTRQQLDLLAQSRVRLEQVIASADAEVARLSESLNETTRTDTASTTETEPAAPAATPEPAAPQTDAEPPQS